MKYYFIDLENVKSAGIHGAKNLTKDSTIYIFYSKNTRSINLDAVSELTKSKAVVQYKKLLETGPNALDFELVSLMSAIIGDKKEGEFYIISNDKGYTAAIRCLIDEYSDKPISIHRESTIANTLDTRADIINKHMSAVIKEKKFDEKLKSLLNGSTFEKHILEIRLIIINTTEKHQFYTTLIDKFGYNLGINIYRSLKGNYYELRDAM